MLTCRPVLPTQKLARSSFAMQGILSPAPFLIAPRRSFRWLALRKLKPLFVSRTCATLSSRVPVNLKGCPWLSTVLNAPPQELPQPPPLPPEQPTATSAAARARRARLRRGLDELLNDMRGPPAARLMKALILHEASACPETDDRPITATYGGERARRLR